MGDVQATFQGYIIIGNYTMNPAGTNIELRIQFVNNKGQKETNRESIDVQLINNQELDIDFIYDHLNKFIERQGIIDSMVIYKDSYQKTRILRKNSELDVEPHQITTDLSFIDLEIVSGDQMKQIEDQIQKLTSAKDNIDKKIQDFQKTMKENRGERTGQECDIAFLHSQPTLKDDTLKTPPSPLPVSYEIQRNGIKWLLKDLNSKGKRINMKSKVGTLQNLRDMVQKSTMILHLSCHGNKLPYQINGSSTYLELQSSQGTQIGALKKFFFYDFKQVFHNDNQSDKNDIVRSKPKVVIINSCFSGEIARKICKQFRIQYTIGINQQYKILNLASQKFSSKFYEEFLVRNNVDKSFEQAIKYVKEEILKFMPKKLWCCCQTHGKHKIHKLECRTNDKQKCICTKYHNNQLTDCQCPNKMYSTHKKDCKVLTLPQVRKYCDLQDEQIKIQIQIQNSRLFRKQAGEFLICCCNKIHDESQKFQLNNYNNDHTQVKFQTELVNTVFAPQQDLFNPQQRISDRFYKVNHIFAEYIKVLLNKNNRVILLTGQQGQGKTSYARKLVYYIIERQSIFELIVINCKNYFSIIDIYLNFKFKRNNNPPMGVDQTVKYLRERTQTMPAFIVFDHCQKLIESSQQQVISMVTTLNHALPNTKILVISNESKALEQLKKKFKGIIKLQDDSFINLLENRYRIQTISSQQRSQIKNANFTNFRNFKEQIYKQQNSTLQLFLKNIKIKRQAQQKVQKELQGILHHIKEQKYLKAILILSIFQAGIKTDEMEIINDLLQKYGGIIIDKLKCDQKISSILDINSDVNFKFKQIWYDFIRGKQEQLKESFSQICNVFFQYMNNYIVCRIQKQPDFLLQQFQISPFQSLPQCNKYLKAINLDGQIIKTADNMKSFLSLNIKTQDEGVRKLYRNILISIPLLVQLLYQQKQASYIHKCINKMNMIEKDPINCQKGKMRLCFQLNRHLMTNEINFKQSMAIINKRLLIQQHISDSILKIEKCVLILQEHHYILQITSQNNLNEELKNSIFKEIAEISKLAINQKFESHTCQSRIYCYVGALIIQLIDKYKTVDLIIARLNKECPYFQLSKMIKQIKQFSNTQQAAYLKRKVKAIYFGLQFHRLQYQKENDIKQFQTQIDQIREWLKESNFEQLNSVIRKITDYISKKKQSLITILTAKPLIYENHYHPIFRFEDRIAQTLSKSLSQKDQKMISIKTYVFNQKNLEESLSEGCIIQFLMIDIVKESTTSANYYLWFQQKNRMRKKISLEDFKKRFYFKNISILILSGLNCNILQAELSKKYSHLFIICIEKLSNPQTRNNHNYYYWEHDQMSIWNQCNKHFLSMFTKVFIHQSPAELLIQRYCSAYQIAKHKIIIKLIENQKTINTQGDIDSYINIYRSKLLPLEKPSSSDNQQIDSQEQEYLSFASGNVVTFFNASQKCQDIEIDNFINCGFNKQICEILQSIKKQNIIVNISGSMKLLTSIGYQVYKSLLRNGQKLVKYLNQNSSPQNKKSLFNYYNRYTYIIFQHKIQQLDTSIDKTIQKFCQMCNGMARKVILLTNTQLMSLKQFKQKFSYYKKVQYQSIPIKQSKISSCAYMHFRKCKQHDSDKLKRLINDTQTYNNLQQTIKSVDRQLSSIKKADSVKSNKSKIYSNG